jgi:hypothetical protein
MVQEPPSPRGANQQSGWPREVAKLRPEAELEGVECSPAAAAAAY